MTGTFSHLELRGRFDTYGEALIEKKTFKKMILYLTTPCRDTGELPVLYWHHGEL